MNCGSGTTDRAPLGDVVDAEALETLLDGSDSVERVAFGYAGYRVVATGDAVELYEPR